MDRPAAADRFADYAALVRPGLDRALGAYLDRVAASVRHLPADVQATVDTVRDLSLRGGKRLRAVLLAAGYEACWQPTSPVRGIGIWSPNNAEWVITQFATAKAGLILVNINPAYRLSELDYALNKVGCKALITADSFKTSDYVGMLRELAPEIDRSVPGKLQAKRLPSLTTLIRIGDDEARLPALCRRARHGRRAPSRGARRAGAEAAIRRSDQHPVHQRHHRRAQGRDADPSQHPQQRLSSSARRCA